MPPLQLIRLSSIFDISAEEWDSIVTDGDTLNSHAYLAAMEQSGINGWSYCYLLFYREQQLVAHVSAGILEFNLDLMAQGGLKRIFSLIRRVLPRFLHIKMIECGHPTALGNTFVLSPAVQHRDILPHIDRELRRVAREHHTNLVLIRDVRTHERRAFLPLYGLGYRIVPNMTNTFLRITQSDFTHYLADLTAKRRHEVRFHRKKFAAQGCSVERVEDFAPWAQCMVELWNNTAARASEYQREQLNAEFFRSMSDQLGKRSFALLCMRNGVPIGFTVLIDAGHSLISTYCGLDYRYNRSTHAYFVLFYASIEAATQLRKNWLELGITSYIPKIELGALPEPLRIYVTATNPVYRLLLAPFLRLTGRTPYLPLRNVFNRQYSQQHQFKTAPAAQAFGVAYRVISASERYIVLDGAHPPLRRRFNLYLQDSFHYPFLLKVRCTKSTTTTRQQLRISCHVIERSSLRLFLWHRFRQRLTPETVT